jgi:hypothetical protein
MPLSLLPPSLAPQIQGPYVPYAFAGMGTATTVPHSDILTNILATKGALLLGGGSGTVKALPVGADTQALIADSTQTLGVRWAGDTSWQSISVTANWVAGGGTLVNYRKDALGFIHFRGVLVNNAGAGNPAFTMAAGTRPGQDAYIATIAGDGGIMSTPFLAMQIVVQASTGNVLFDGLPAAGYYTMLDSLTYLAEQ